MSTDIPTGYTGEGVFLDDIVWKLRGQLAVLSNLNSDNIDEAIHNGIHTIATECMLALSHIEEQRIGWAPTPDQARGSDA